ncbi:MAG: FAD-dependent oxidoreductase [Bacteroidetes bacterium]|nr:FAD-dependent oxidoreductase [Bacteroidota bacterium]
MNEINSSQFADAIKNDEIVILDFYSTECPPCEALAPKFEALSELYGAHVKFLKIYRQDNRDLATELGVSSSPSIIFFKNGEKVGDILSGGVRRADMQNQLDELLPDQIVKEIKSKIVPKITETEVLIIGGGPAGLTAGIYLAQAKVKTIIIDIAMPGGQVSTTHQVSNYPGFIDPVNGYMLSHYMTEQTKLAGVEFRTAVDVSNVDLIKKELIVDAQETIKAKKIIIATGASPRFINIPGEKEFKGKGVSYCATCDAKYYHDKEVVIIGGGNTAVEESEFISKFASKITMIHQFDKLTSNKEAQERAMNNPKIKILFEHEPRAFEKNGDKMVVQVENLKTKEISKIETDGIFVFVGMKPNLDLFTDALDMDEWGYIKANDEMKTSLPDVYAVGDVISKKYRQITTAVADGTIASIALTKELS